MGPSADASFKSLPSQLEEKGHARITVDPSLTEAIRHSFAINPEFFLKPMAEKRRFALSAHGEGYRQLGQEYSKTPDRPDLTESFSVWRRNRARPELAAWSASCALHGPLSAIFDRMTEVTRAIFQALADHYAPGAPELRFRDGSWLQTNYYEPASHARELLQDPHEDMHLITLVCADAPGLEIEVDGEFVPAELGADELLLMPGSILTLMTGGRVKPLYHQVRNNHRNAPRSSLMFFVNPEVDQVLQPWIAAPINAGIDIVAHATAGPSNFGLPTAADAPAKEAAAQ